MSSGRSCLKQFRERNPRGGWPLPCAKPDVHLGPLGYITGAHTLSAGRAGAEASSHKARSTWATARNCKCSPRCTKIMCPLRTKSLLPVPHAKFSGWSKIEALAIAPLWCGLEPRALHSYPSQQGHNQGLKITEPRNLEQPISPSPNTVKPTSRSPISKSETKLLWLQAPRSSWIQYTSRCRWWFRSRKISAALSSLAPPPRGFEFAGADGVMFSFFGFKSQEFQSRTSGFSASRRCTSRLGRWQEPFNSQLLGFWHTPTASWCANDHNLKEKQWWCRCCLMVAATAMTT